MARVNKKRQRQLLRLKDRSKGERKVVEVEISDHHRDLCVCHTHRLGYSPLENHLKCPLVIAARAKLVEEITNDNQIGISDGNMNILASRIPRGTFKITDIKEVKSG